MKKNDIMGYIVYALMIGIAVGVGLGIIQPYFKAHAVLGGSNISIVFVLLIVLGAIIFTALMLELGHLLGAKIGKYKVTSWNCLFLQWKRGKDDKFHFAFSNYDGITGETKYVPLNAEKSNPRHIIYTPLVFFLLEVALCAVSIVVGNSLGEGYEWCFVAGVVVLTVASMIFLYDIFPASLDGKNDGHLIPILNNAVNVRAYNEMLLAEDKMSRGEKIGTTPVYETVTDFTSHLNDLTIYRRLTEGDFKGALEINEFTILSKDKVSRKIYNNAVAQKIAIDLYTKPFEEAKEEYIALPLEEKKFIASLSTAPSVRAYLLISGLIDDSINETKTAMDNANSAIKASGEDKRIVEERLMKLALQKVIKVHSDWDFSEYKEFASIKKEDKSKEEEK